MSESPLFTYLGNKEVEITHFDNTLHSAADDQVPLLST